MSEKTIHQEELLNKTILSMQLYKEVYITHINKGCDHATAVKNSNLAVGSFNERFTYIGKK